MHSTLRSCGLATRSNLVSTYHIATTTHCRTVTDHPPETVLLTANASIVPTHTFETCPKLDMLFIPGPPAGYHPPKDLSAFLLKMAGRVDVVMSDCSGPAVLAELGLLDGKRATINKEAVGLMKQAFPKVEWVDDERWVVDGNTWTAGGAVAGMDMMVAFLKSDKLRLGDLAELGSKLIEYTPRSQFYK
jgi:transcriptional regulator GlxA family with amidase domain